MIAIMGVDSADVINKADSDTTTIRMIPNNRLKLESNELSFYKPLFEQDCSVQEEPDPSEYISKDELPSYFWDYIQICIESGNFPTEEQLDPNNYYLKSSLPTFLNKFVAMALTKPAQIAADSYINICRLLNAEPKLLANNQIYAAPRAINTYSTRFPSKSLSITPRYSSVSGGAQVSISADGYYMQQNCGLNIPDILNQDTFYIYDISIKTTFETSARTMLLDFYPSNNSTDTLKAMFLEKTAANQMRCFIRNATTPGSSIDVKLDTTDMDIQRPVSFYYTRNQFDTNNAIIGCDYTSTSGRFTTKETVVAISENMYPKAASARLGYRISRSSSTTNATVTGAKTLHSLSINAREGRQYVNFDTSKIIENKLLTIV